MMTRKTVLIVAIGSWGDVVPYTGLGIRLRAAGYHMAIAAHEPSHPGES
jgi:sterol 3beta-glucosyltransferase